MQTEGQPRVVDGLREFQRFATAVRNKGLRTLAAKVKASTRERIKTTKRSPDGEAWRPWSPAYAATRKRRHSLLIDTRKLLTTLATRPKAGEILVGSPRPYAKKVQQTKSGEDKRPFLGIGRDEVPGLQRELDRWAGREFVKMRDRAGGVRGNL